MVAVTGSSIAGGFGVALAAGACFETSYALQALEARGVEARHALRASLLGQLVRRRRWLAAIALAIAGWVLQVAALGLAPLTLVQPTLALGLLLLLVLGVRVLGEHVGRREVVAVSAIVLGVTGIALASPERVEAVPGGLELALVGGGLGLLTIAPFVLRERGGRRGAALVASAGAADAWAAFAAKLISDELSAGRTLAAAAWAVSAGLAVLLGLTSEMTALQRLPATRVAPVVLVMQIVIPVLLAPLVIGEDWGSTPLGGGLLAASLATVAAGAALLGASRAISDLLTGGPPAAGAEPVEHHRGGGGQLGE
jgi:drug/metabolite transporter (DMT)-like permease